VDISFNISRLESVLLGDTRNDPFDPTRGNLISTELEYAPSFLGSDSRFIKTFSQFFHYQTFKQITSASGIRFGMGRTIRSTERLLISERFLTGGANTIRGFGFEDLGQPFGGEAELILNQEFRFPIFWRIGGVAFYDGGNIYPRYNDFSF